MAPKTACRGLLNALKVTGRDIRNTRFALVGMGAASVVTLRLLLSSGVCMEQILATDCRGILHPDRHDVEQQRGDYPDKWRLCLESNVDNRRGGIAEALQGADVCTALAQPGPGTIKPEIWPWEAKEAGARIVATGRSDFPNQLNNSACEPQRAP